MQEDLRQRYLDIYDRLTEDLLDVYADMDKRGFQQPLGEGKWTPGEVLDHLLKTDQGVLLLIEKTPAAPEGAGRAADEKVEKMSQFRKTDQLLPSPPQLLPGDRQHFDRVKMLDQLADLRADIRVAFDFHEHVATLVEMYPHPLFGRLTICEWFYFTAMHGERHRLQVIKGLEIE